MSWQVARIDELEALPVDQEGLVWRPVRRRFGIQAFGANAYTAAKAGDRVVEEHTETTNGHEELYFVAEGSAHFTVDGDEFDAAAGPFPRRGRRGRRGGGHVRRRRAADPPRRGRQRARHDDRGLRRQAGGG